MLVQNFTKTCHLVMKCGGVARRLTPRPQKSLHQSNSLILLILTSIGVMGVVIPRVPYLVPHRCNFHERLYWVHNSGGRNKSAHPHERSQGRASLDLGYFPTLAMRSHCSFSHCLHSIVHILAACLKRGEKRIIPLTNVRSWGSVISDSHGT